MSSVRPRSNSIALHPIDGGRPAVLEGLADDLVLRIVRGGAASAELSLAASRGNRGTVRELGVDGVDTGGLLADRLIRNKPLALADVDVTTGCADLLDASAMLSEAAGGILQSETSRTFEDLSATSEAASSESSTNNGLAAA